MRVQDRLPEAAGPFCFHRSDMSEFADVRASDEGLIARPCQNDAAHLSVIPRLFESRPQVRPRSVIESVENLGTIHRHIGDGALLFVQNVLE